MDAEVTKMLVSVEPIAARISMNTRHITIGFRPDDDPAERARKVYHRAYERYAIARDILALASMADWAALEVAFKAEADELREKACKAGEPKADAAAIVDVHLPT